LRGFYFFKNKEGMYENKKQRLAPAGVFYHRIRKNFFIAAFILFVSLCIGIAGYEITIPEFGFYDSLLNASMILSGMGPVIDGSIRLSNAAKIFASFYALFSGITFLSTFGVLIAPVLHRFLHKLHLDESEDQ
jgi:hypothetical protein